MRGGCGKSSCSFPVRAPIPGRGFGRQRGRTGGGRSGRWFVRLVSEGDRQLEGIEEIRGIL